MTDGKELRSRAFSLDPRFSYLTKEDRYLFHVEEPKYRFNVIGCGVNGNEHIYITQLEGRAIIHGIFDTNPGSVVLAQKTCAGFSTDHDLVIYNSLEAACNDLLHNDLYSFGEKMRETHIGLRDEFEVSEPFIDFLFDFTLNDDGVLGSRIMGGGFGGCTINLVKKDYTKEFVERTKKAYNEKSTEKLKIYITSIEDGTSVIENDP